MTARQRAPDRSKRCHAYRSSDMRRGRPSSKARGPHFGRGHRKDRPLHPAGAPGSLCLAHAIDSIPTSLDASRGHDWPTPGDSRRRANLPGSTRGVDRRGDPGCRGESPETSLYPRPFRSDRRRTPPAFAPRPPFRCPSHRDLDLREGNRSLDRSNVSDFRSRTDRYSALRRFGRPECDATTLWTRRAATTTRDGGHRGPLAPLCLDRLLVLLAFSGLSRCPCGCPALGHDKCQAKPSIPIKVCFY